MPTEERDIAVENGQVRPEYAAGNGGYRGGHFGGIVSRNTRSSVTLRLFHYSAFRRDIPPLCETYHGVEKPESNRSRAIQGAADGSATTVEHVRVDHGGFDVLMPEQLLDGTDVVAIV